MTCESRIYAVPDVPLRIGVLLFRSIKSSAEFWLRFIFINVQVVYLSSNLGLNRLRDGWDDVAGINFFRRELSILSTLWLFFFYKLGKFRRLVLVDGFVFLLP